MCVYACMWKGCVYYSKNLTKQLFLALILFDIFFTLIVIPYFSSLHVNHAQVIFNQVKNNALKGSEN